MIRALRTVVAAAAAPAVRRMLCSALAEAELALLAMPANGMDALSALRSLRPEILIADMELPLLEGHLLASRALMERDLPVRPACIVLRHPEFVPPGMDRLEALGVRFLEKPLMGAALRRAVEEMQAAPPRLSPGMEARLDALLNALGVPEHAGRACLRAAVLLCAGDERFRHNLLHRLYPAAGACCGMSAAQAQRAMRHAIDLAWQSDQFENQYRIFADTVDAGRGQPTCGEMISRLADILRLEG